MDAVPLDMDTGLDQTPSWSDHSVAFDATVEFLGFTEVDATQYIYENYVQLTTGSSVMDGTIQLWDHTFASDIHKCLYYLIV